MHSPYAKISGASSGAIKLGNSDYRAPGEEVYEEHVSLDGEPYVCIRNIDALKPFLMSIVSNGNIWIFAGSNGAFSAGRSNPDGAIFPYQTADRILGNVESAGAMTLLLVRRDNEAWSLWEPWRSSGRLYQITRNLYKHTNGSVLLFEEINHDLGLSLRWSLTASEQFGLVRECELKNLSSQSVTVKYLDGWHHLLPAGVVPDIYARMSYLVAGYMRHERREDSPLGIYTLNSHISDRSEPVESLRASCAWSLGHENPTVLLSTRQVDAFLQNADIHPETEVRGNLGAYLVVAEKEIKVGQDHRWINMADTGLDHRGLFVLEKKLHQPDKLEIELKLSISENNRGLWERIAAADGLQETADRSTSVHHFANVLFNCMRGGTFTQSYVFPGSDFADFLKTRNADIYALHEEWLKKLPEQLTLREFEGLAAKQKDLQLSRLAGEYLPLTFSRRHGDPSRPWNRFVIRVKNEQNELIYDYQGNWRDIFQNWEGLAHSFPVALERMIAVFLNASTADGYNPYRVTRAGIDWEVIDEEDPWSHIGYWGDHQLIYLLRLLQAFENHYPGRLASSLDERRYSSARVPYEIRGFDEIVRDPGHSIHFNDKLHASLLERAEKIGNDGKLVRDENDEVALSSLAEKLLVPLLAKLSNLVPEGGIWMNTQRPDWNDANNALVGWGLSMVTVYQMRPYLCFMERLFASSEARSYSVSTPVAEFVTELGAVLAQAAERACHQPEERYAIIEALGRAGEKHRACVYADKLGSRSNLPATAIHELLHNALKVADATIRANRREDGMYHSYNLLQIHDRKASINRLQLMLEGQVAVLSSQLLNPEEALSVLGALRKSELYRPDQHSYMLYPNREITPFLSRNTLPKDWMIKAPALRELAAAHVLDIVVLDEEGAAHFQADLTNSGDLRASLDRLAKEPRWQSAVARDRDAIAQLWEEVFDHSKFTGRSGTMFAFEGLGSIYWHMVGKLLLAVEETYENAVRTEAAPKLIHGLHGFYKDVRSGLGFTKTPQVYGAFPSDPYSHSPAHMGAQQPGMTGQVKEEILSRWGELGVQVVDGCIHFQPRLLDPQEFFADKHLFKYLALDGTQATWELPAESLGFTYCQTPVCYQITDAAGSIRLQRMEGETRLEGTSLSPADSAEIFSRTGTIEKIVVYIPRKSLQS